MVPATGESNLQQRRVKGEHNARAGAAALMCGCGEFGPIDIQDKVLIERRRSGILCPQSDKPALHRIPKHLAGIVDRACAFAAAWPELSYSRSCLLATVEKAIGSSRAAPSTVKLPFGSSAVEVSHSGTAAT